MRAPLASTVLPPSVPNAAMYPTPALPAVARSPFPGPVRPRILSTLRAELCARLARGATDARERLGAALRDPTVPQLAGSYWLALACVDFLNDWLVAGLVSSFRPVGFVVFDVAIWWSTWAALTPILVAVARRGSPARVGVGRAVVAHALAMLVVAFAHVALAALVFEVLDAGPDSWSARFSRFSGAFTLSECLAYWGFVGLLYATALRREGPPEDDVAEPTDLAPDRPARRFMVREGDRIFFVDVDDIDYIEADGNYIRLHAASGEHLVRGTLTGADRRLDPVRFVRIHRSTVVNVDRVREVRPWFGGDYVAVLEDGRELRVSRTYRDRLLRPVL